MDKRIKTNKVINGVNYHLWGVALHDGIDCPRASVPTTSPEDIELMPGKISRKCFTYKNRNCCKIVRRCKGYYKEYNYMVGYDGPARFDDLRDK